MDGGRGRDTDRRRDGIRIGVVWVLPGGHHRSTEPSEEQWTKPGGKARTDEGTPDESWIDESAVESLRRHVLVAKWLVRHGMRQAARPCHNGGGAPHHRRVIDGQRDASKRPV
jgi:hypothetical protein